MKIEDYENYDIGNYYTDEELCEWYSQAYFRGYQDGILKVYKNMDGDKNE